jgi:transposase
VVKAYQNILLGKSLTGVAAANANKLALDKGICAQDACRQLRIEAARKQGEMVRSKDGKPLRRMSCRKLAVAYSIESVEATRKKKGSPVSSQVAFSLIAKFQDCTKLYVTGKRGKPHFKARQDSVSLQCQVTESTPHPLAHDRGETYVDLSRVAGEQCSKVPVLFHRPLPDGCAIKRVALTLRGQRRYVVFQVDAPLECFARDFTEAPGQVAGVDPGRKVALSVSSSDGSYAQTVQPPLCRDRRYLRKLRRTQRKLDRQRRMANPECYDDRGRCKLGHRPKVRTKRMAETQSKLSEMARHLVEARNDFYHRTAIHLLTRFDRVGVGKWRGKGHAPGEGKAKRAQVRKDADHAISNFVGILKDKASLSRAPKQALDVREHGTTRDCFGCGQPTGPSGLKDLKVREWTCTNCGAFHKRDFSAARAIARRANEMAEAGAQSGVTAAVKGRTKRGRAKAQTRTELQASKIPVAHEAGPVRAVARMTPSAASAARVSQDGGNGHQPVAGVASNDLPGGHTHHADESRKPLAEGKAQSA